MNRFIELSRQQEFVSFQISIYRDDRAYCGYAVHCFRKSFAPIPARVYAARIAEDLLLSECSVRKFNG
ncbi:MAG: hypothetical protein KME43_22235 [Myxacorys chilensis ATA2-1-KO14]|jgi:hypothetical protein|nr:hypothetical protein [Myxacorys chilensis ATA2-1-KO14]